jgi:hypothetical protein
VRRRRKGKRKRKRKKREKRKPSVTGFNAQCPTPVACFKEAVKVVAKVGSTGVLSIKLGELLRLAYILACPREKGLEPPS